MLRVGRIGGGLLLAATCASPARAGDLDLAACSPRVDRAAFDPLRPAVERVGQELRAVDRALAVAGSRTSLKAWALTGSGLTAPVPGRDMTVTVWLDLGRVPCGEPAVAAVLDRVDEALRAFEARRPALTTPGLVLSRVEGLGLRDVRRPTPVETTRLAAALRSGPGLLASEEPVPIDACVEYLSTLVRSRADVAPGIGEVCVRCVFATTVCDAAAPGAERHVILLPRDGPTLAAPFRETVYVGAYPTLADRDRFVETLWTGPSLAEVRDGAVARRLEVARTAADEGRLAATLVPLTGALGLLAPVLDAPARDGLGRELADALRSPGAGLQDLGDAAERLARAAEAGASLWVYVECGAIRDLLVAEGAAIEALAAVVDEVEARRLRALGAALARAVAEPASAPLWRAVAADASAAAARLGPPAAEVERWSRTLREAAAAAGAHRAELDADDLRLDLRPGR